MGCKVDLGTPRSLKPRIKDQALKEAIYVSWKLARARRDMVTCAQNIQMFVSGMTFEDFLDDPRTIRAVAFELTTLGEATKAVPNEVKAKYPQIAWGEVQGIRNVLVHEYFRLDEEILWKAAPQDIPPLLNLLEEMKYHKKHEITTKKQRLPISIFLFGSTAKSVPFID